MCFRKCVYNALWRLGHLPFIKLFAFFAVEILGGYRIYHRLKRRYTEDAVLFLCPHSGTGDIYNIGLYFSCFLAERGIRKYAFLYRGSSERQVGRLFGIQEGTILSEREVVRLTRFVRFVGPQNTTVVQLHHYPFPVYANASLANFEGYKGITFTRMFKKVVMNLENDVPPMQPRFSEGAEVKAIFSQSGLNRGKTAILAPYSTSAQVIGIDIWEVLIEKLKDAGYTVATNCAPGRESPIPGTVELAFEYQYAKAVIEYAGIFIGARSGLCDVISSLNCKKIILTPYWSADLPWLGKPGKTMRFYGMRPNYGRADTAEIEYSSDCTELIPDKVMELLEQPEKWACEIRLSR